MLRKTKKYFLAYNEKKVKVVIILWKLFYFDKKGSEDEEVQGRIDSKQKVAHLDLGLWVIRTYVS